MVEPLPAAEGHAPDAGGVLAELQRQVAAPLADRPRRLGERHARGGEDGPPIALAERGEPLELRHRLERDPGERGLAIDRELRPPQLCREPPVDLRNEGLAKRVDPPILDLEACRGGMATAGDEMLATGHERRMHVESGHAPHTPRRGPPLVRVAGDHDDRPVEPLGEPTGHDSDHARLPATFGEHERRVSRRVEPLRRLLGRRELDAPLHGLPLHVRLVQTLRQLLGAGGVGRREHLDATARIAHAAGRVEPGRKPEGDVLALEL